VLGAVAFTELAPARKQFITTVNPLRHLSDRRLHGLKVRKEARDGAAKEFVSGRLCSVAFEFCPLFPSQGYVLSHFGSLQIRTIITAHKATITPTVATASGQVIALPPATQCPVRRELPAPALARAYANYRDAEDSASRRK
jgi:hypothetical protein